MLGIWDDNVTHGGNFIERFLHEISGGIKEGTQSPLEQRRTLTEMVIWHGL